MMLSVATIIVYGAASAAAPTVIVGRDIAGVAVEMPLAGLGTGGYWIRNSSAVYAGVKQALELGYRHLDTALGYGTQPALAQAIVDSGVPRSEIFILSKIRGGLDGDRADQAIQKSLAQLGSHADAMLLHYPGSWHGDGGKTSRQASWLALEKAYKAGMVRSIGVSHYCPRHIQVPFATLPNFPLHNDPGCRDFNAKPP